MKKSNALMLSYVVFLIVALLAKIFYKWEGIDEIAMGATIAGCFFAFADLSNWYASNSTLVLDAIQKDQDALAASCAAHIKKTEAQIKETEEIKKKIEPYCSRLEHAEKLRNLCFVREKGLKQTYTELKEIADNDIGKLQEPIDKQRKKISVFQITDMVFITVGFVVFFVLTAFEAVASLFESYQPHATIIAFTLIMLNYFLRDIIDERTKKQVSGLLERVEFEKIRIGEIERSSEETPLLDEVDRMIQRLEEIDGIKGMCVNG